jgi:serine/threonine protein kinase
MFANTDLIEAVANRQFATLAHLEPVWDEQYDEPWYSTGKMGIVFKLSDPATGQRFALKVFKERDTEREDRLRQIAEQLAAYPSPYWVSYQFLADEIRIESPFGDDETACVLLMEWIEGQTMGQFVRDACARTDRAALHKLAYAFDQMALWLLANPFAHGDLKHDNILIRPNGVPALVDYDGLFFPVFTDLQALELGTPDYQHPKRTAQHYGLYLDDFSLLVISLSLYALSHRPDLYATHNTGENLLLTLSDFEQPRRSQLLGTLQELEATPVRQRLALLDYALVLPPQSLPGLEVLLRDKVGHYATLQALSRPSVPDLIPYRKGKKWGFCDRNKKIVIECVYDGAVPFEESLAWVKQDGKWGGIDRTGHLAIPCQFDSARPFSEDLACVEQEGEWGFVNKIGRLAISCQFKHAQSFSEGLAPVKQGEKYGFIDKTGHLAIPHQFDNDKWFGGSHFSEGLAAVKQGGKWGFIDKSGNMAIPPQYDRAYSFSEGIAPVCQGGKEESFIGKWIGGKWGFIDKMGSLIVSYRFEAIGQFSEGLAYVKQNGKWGFIDKVGFIKITDSNGFWGMT